MPPNSLCLCEIEIFLQLSHWVGIKPKEQDGGGRKGLKRKIVGGRKAREKTPHKTSVALFSILSLLSSCGNESLNSSSVFSCVVKVLSFKTKLHDESGWNAHSCPVGHSTGLCHPLVVKNKTINVIHQVQRATETKTHQQQSLSPDAVFDQSLLSLSSSSSCGRKCWMDLIL